MDTESIKKAVAYSGVSMAEVARRIGMKPQSLQNRLTRGTLKPGDLEAIAAAIGGTFYEYIEFPDGVKIGIADPEAAKARSKDLAIDLEVKKIINDQEKKHAADLEARKEAEKMGDFDKWMESMKHINR